MACESAPDGERAIAMLEAAARSRRPFALALLDSKMPGMNGIELVRSIRAHPELEGLRLLMLTSSGNARDAASDAGADGFITKPVRQARLYDEVGRVLGAAQAALPAATGTVAHAGPGGRVLVAEDNAVSAQVAVGLLEQRGFDVEVAGDGAQALAMHAIGDYAAIFLDCQLPSINGFDVAAEIRRREGDRRHTPIIAMTANAMTGDRERCLAAGMDDYLEKPVRTAALDAAIRAIEARQERPRPVLAADAHGARTRPRAPQFARSGV